MRILIVGAGAVGGYFGARLMQVGRDVTFLVREQRAAQIRQHGLRIASPHGDMTLAPQMVRAGEHAAPFDVVLVSVKAYALDAAIADFAPFVESRTMVYPVLNGMRHMDVLLERFGPAALIGGVAQVATEVREDGSIVQLAPLQSLAYGELDGTVSERLRAMHAVFQGAGFDARLSSAIRQDLWNKWVFLASLGAITCLLRGAVGEVEAAPGGEATARRILAECASVAEAAGFPLSAPALDQFAATLTAKGSKFTASMYRDLIAGRPVEADHILGDLLARGHDGGVDLPLLAAAHVSLSIYQAGRVRG